MQNTYKIYARGVVLNEKNQVLLLKKKSNQILGGGEWLLPGGTVEFGENIEHTLIREIKEETNLDISEIEILTHKKMLIGDDHRVGIYFICKVSNEKELTNMEPEKHDTIGFFDLNDIPKMKDYIIVKMLSNFTKEHFNYVAIDWKQHSMQRHLIKYIENKIHTLLKENIKNIKYIQIIGNYDRSDIVSKEEKKDKIFNFKRPTAFYDGDTIYISCFPGDDYVRHYANLIATYYKINGFDLPIISYRLPNKKFIYDIFKSVGIDKLPNSETIIFGNVDKLGIFEEINFIKCGDFYYKKGLINGKEVMLVGCEFSIWGNIGYYFINAISKNIKFKNFIYIGKLGILDKDIEPNKFIATGNVSYLNNEKIERDNIFTNIKGENILFSDHISIYSVIEESIYNIGEYSKLGKFIDPEIGNMAYSCKENGKNFSYLHIVSDNVIIPLEENLSNERKSEILSKRKELFLQIGNILKITL